MFSDLFLKKKTKQPFLLHHPRETQETLALRVMEKTPHGHFRSQLIPLIAANMLKKPTLKMDRATQAMTVGGDDNVDFSTFVS